MRLRSGRFAAVVCAYVAVCAVPAVVFTGAAARSRYFIGAEAFAAALMTIQPLATAIFAGVAAVDALTREREEGSFEVTSLARSSAAGYVLRRWLAVVAVVAPVTLIPVAVAFGAATFADHHAAPAAAFLLRWLVQIAPVVVIFSALGVAMGTISGRPAAGAILAALLFTADFTIINDIAARAHRHFDGFAPVVVPDSRHVQRLFWAVRGWMTPEMPTEAGFDARNEAAATLPAAAIPAAIALLLFAITPLYARRTRRDLRPWRISPQSSFRTLLTFVNRLRTEYALDGMSSLSDRLTAIIGIAAAAALVIIVMQRFNVYERLAADAYAALHGGPAEMSAAVVPQSVDATVSITGDELHSLSTIALRNDSSAPITHLAFEVTPSMRATNIRASRGTTAVSRLWHRLGVELSPPLAPSEVRHMHFTLDGTPGVYRFALREPFAASYAMFRRGTEAIDLADLSRSHLDRSIARSHLLLRATDMIPVPRYTDWRKGEEQNTPISDVRVRGSLPRAIVAAESCGNVARGDFTSQCRTPLATFGIVGAEYRTAAAGESATLLYLDAHRQLAPLHAASLAEAIRTARAAWPEFIDASHTLFVEAPSARPGEENRWWDESIRMLGRAYAVPEVWIARKEAVKPSYVAASLIASAIEMRRGIVATDVPAWRAFIETIAELDTGSKRVSAVVPGVGAGAPITTPLLSSRPEAVARQRVGGIVSELENRVGRDRIKTGITDFVRASRAPGTMAELIATIGRRSGVDLHRFYSDYFTGDALPLLTLAGVTFDKRGEQWVVSGTLVNRGTGESFCPIALRTAAGSQTQTIHIDSNQRVPFSFVTAATPQAVQLDPLKVCYRYAAVGVVESVEWKGAGS